MKLGNHSDFYFKGFKIKLRPTDEQKKLLQQMQKINKNMITQTKMEQNTHQHIMVQPDYN